MAGTGSNPDGSWQPEPGEPVRIWPGAAPGSESWSHVEYCTTDPVTGASVIRDVVVPTLTPVLPRPGEANGTGVVVAPGGAFTMLAWNHEGIDTARWFARRGVAAFVLRYRLTRPPSDPAELAALEGSMPDPADSSALRAWARAALGNAIDLASADGEQAVRFLRGNAAAWGLDGHRVGILGYSAGGTVATHAAVTDDPAARPAFVVNMYGAWFDRDVPADAPAYFGVAAGDDHVILDAWLQTSQAWVKAGAPAEIHLYERGGHGFGTTQRGLPVDRWTDRLAEWLTSRDLMLAKVTDECGTSPAQKDHMLS